MEQADIKEVRTTAQLGPDSLEPETARQAGLLKGRVQWEDGAFAPMTDAEVAEFDGVCPIATPPHGDSDRSRIRVR